MPRKHAWSQQSSTSRRRTVVKRAAQSLTVLFILHCVTARRFALRKLRPVMYLSAGQARGFCNQRSVMLTALYLAAMLRWDVILPAIFSPLECNNMSLDCYDYKRFTGFPFHSLYDVQYFSEFVAREYGIRVYMDLESLPRSYRLLSSSELPCNSPPCRGTFDTLRLKYSRISGPSIVTGPGIAAGLIDSHEHFLGVQLASKAFHPSAAVAAEAYRRIAEIVGTQKVTVGLHWRFENDVESKAVKLVDETIFMEQVISSLSHHAIAERELIFYVAGGGGPENVEENTVFRKARSRKWQVYRPTSSNNTMTFFNAGVDFVVSSHLDFFFGHPFSSFSGFVAVGRHVDSKHVSLIPSFMQLGCRMLEAWDAISHWQYELTLPIQDCHVPDPCKVFYYSALRKRKKTPNFLQSCTYTPDSQISVGKTYHHDERCSGMTNLLQTCSHTLH